MDDIKDNKLSRKDYEKLNIFEKFKYCISLTKYKV